MAGFKRWNLLIYFAIFFGLSLGGQAVRLVTDYFWFQEVGFEAVFARSLSVKAALAAAAGLFVLAGALLNLWLARRVSRRPFVVIGPDVSLSAPLPLPQVAELRPLLEGGLLFAAIAAGFFTGSWASGHWETVLRFFYGVPFASQEPIFGRDIGFYVFQVPLYHVLFRLLLTAVLVSFVAALLIYLLNARIYFSARGVEVADDARLHLAVLGGFLSLTLALHFQLEMYDLLTQQRSLAPGAGYADIRATLPGLQALRFLALASALLLWSYPWVRRARLILAAAALLVGGAFLVRVYTSVVQKFEVAPNEIAKETPYIKLAIENTRRAYGLTDVQELEFDPVEDLTPETLRRNDITIKNIRLWEHRPLLTTYGQLQEIRTYYDFLDADNDRYLINGEYRQVMLSVRELVPDSLPSRIWINEHLTYTHGYGLCLGPVNRISPEGLPEFFIKDIPPASSSGLKIQRPQIYYGEAPARYAIVNTASKEFDYPSGDQNVYTVYEGRGGVPAGNLLKRLLFAARFGELKILFSGDIGASSRFLYYRSVRERLAQAAPFLRFDADPYIVIADDGRLFWMADGYSVTDRYPYSENSGGINYVRNSVKATVDAYDGALALYVSDPEDPVIRTYAAIFPGLLRPLDAMPADLRRHIRYPQTLMNLQARIYSLYHMTDPQVFYNKEDLWKIPTRTQGGRSEPMEPYYTIMKLAGVGEREEFILMVPFTPSKKENMIAWLAARCDAPDYGKLIVYNFPKQKLVYGPQQIESRIDQDAEISKQLTLWNQGGSRVLRGSLLVIPVDRSLLYVQPLYLEAAGGGLPELKRVIVAYGNAIAMEENLELSLLKLFGGRLERGERMERPAGAGAGGMARQAHEIFERAQSAARRGDWAAYGEGMKQLERLLRGLSGLP